MIGLEVHCQLVSASKLFSSSSTSYGSPPNSQTSAIDAALPGTLPSLNAHAVRQCIRTALALHTVPQALSRFERKHYFYADLPQGYQITQQRFPIIRGGRLGEVRIDRVQLEQDSGKSLHDLHPQHSHVDLNRAGMALLEVVTRPELRSAEEAATFVRRLAELLRHIGVCRAQMEEGEMRVDVNVSVRGEGEQRGGERVEVKNLNSLRAVVRAIEYEVQRQVDVREAGMEVKRETRTFDARQGVTLLLRSKEQLLDYRFMPEPDLPWLRIDEEEVQLVREQMGETREELLHRLQSDYGLSSYDAQVLVSEADAVAFFERLVHGEEEAQQRGGQLTGGGGQAKELQMQRQQRRPVVRSPKLAVSWLTTDLFGRIRRQIEDAAKTHSGAAADEGAEEASSMPSGGAVGVRAADGGRRVLLLSMCPVSSLQLASIIDLVEAGRISGKVGKAVLDEMMEAADERPLADSIVGRRGWWVQQADEATMDAWLVEVLRREEEGVQRYLTTANHRFVGYLVGEVMKESRGKGNPREVAKAVQSRLEQLSRSHQPGGEAAR